MLVLVVVCVRKADPLGRTQSRSHSPERIRRGRVSAHTLQRCFAALSMTNVETNDSSANQENLVELLMLRLHRFGPCAARV